MTAPNTSTSPAVSDTTPLQALTARLAAAHGVDVNSPLSQHLLPRAALLQPSPLAADPKALQLMLSYDSDEFGSGVSLFRQPFLPSVSLCSFSSALTLPCLFFFSPSAPLYQLH